MMDFDYEKLLSSKLNIIKGIGEKRLSYFKELGVYTIKDLLYFFPRKYEDRSRFVHISDAVCGDVCSIHAFVRGAIIEKKIKKNISLYIMRVEDSTGVMNVKWFSSPFNKHKIKRGMHYSFYGTIARDGQSVEMLLRELEPYGENCLLGRIIPIYSLSNGLHQNDVRNAVNSALEMTESFCETLPESIIKEYGLLPLDDAIRQMHNPDDSVMLSSAKERIAFEELLVLTLALKRVRKSNFIESNILINDIMCVKEFASSLPYELTHDQKKVINEICSDLKNKKPMNRLVQGDVGSGKTAVAAAAAYIVCKNGYQTALMAPTEILAHQHHKALSVFFKGHNINVGLITGSTKNKQDVLRDIKNGKYDVVVGTHALIQDRTIFKNLGLCITDEQHRFGVMQRAALSKGADTPNVLVMSATPIPRTLSLVIYGDLDISLITTMPKGRQKIDTFCVGNSMRARLNGFIEKHIESGKQCFVVCPLIEESEEINAVSGQDAYENLCKIFTEKKVAFLHGKMDAATKEHIMEDFKNNKKSILVSTTVIEVGIDVPNATLIVIENAERFGLSQLHQLRGRVGRGADKSYCILVSECTTDSSKERMNIMCKTSDGFKIAEEDLRLRGSGEFFGTRQHGVPELKVANLFTDMPVVQRVTSLCTRLTDKEINSDEFSTLKSEIEKLIFGFQNKNIFN